MTNKWRNCELQDVITLQRGHDLPKSKMQDGKIPVAGSNGIIGFHNQSTTHAPGVTIGRSGNLGNAYFYKEDFWAHNTTLYVKDFKGNNEAFIYYFLKALDFSRLNAGSAVPTLNRNHIHPIPVNIPPFPEQRAIAGILSSLDDKIDLLHRQNETLEALAETLFRQWFIEEARDDWEEGVLGAVINIFDSKRIPLSKLERDKMKDGKLYPYYGAAKIMEYINDFIFDGEYILLGEDGTVITEEGCPILQYATGKFWVNNHTHVIQAKLPYTNFFIWTYLKNKNISEIVTGAVQPKINQTNLKSLDFPIYPFDLVDRFNNLTKPMFEKINKNKKQIQTLEKLRDTILPKLISGEVRVRGIP